MFSDVCLCVEKVKWGTLVILLGGGGVRGRLLILMSDNGTVTQLANGLQWTNVSNRMFTSNGIVENIINDFSIINFIILLFIKKFPSLY